MKQFDFLVFIGRFQPFHCGHLAVVKQALSQSKHIILLLGTAHQPRSLRDPFSVEERSQMIRDHFSSDDNRRIHLCPLIDVLYNDEVWIRNVQKTVDGALTAFFDKTHQAPVVGLIGHSKDHTSYYLNRFPQWQAVNVANFKQLSATPLRQAFFDVDCLQTTNTKQLIKQWQQQQWIADGTADFLYQFMGTPTHQHLIAEHAFITEYKAGWHKSPYPPTFVTVDAVVVQSGHILMIERRARPGKGLYALPGGFLDKDEQLIDACVRELREETRLKVPLPVLKGSCVKQRVYDAPHRSARGRTITHAFLFELNPSHDLPKVKGEDDAKQAFWQPISKLSVSELFEDHYFIIQDMLGASD